MNDFDDIPFENVDQSENVTQSFDELPFDDSSIVPQMTENNILIFDERIKDIPAKNTKVIFKRPSIIFPIIAFVFVSILGMYLFVVNGKADTMNLIKIEENRKFGYIDSEGTIVTRCKYTYGSDYYKGYAIVKNTNNLYGILNGKGVLEVPFGNYQYIGLFGGRYIASEITKDGLKVALLDSRLKELTNFKYDSISYAKNGMYLFTRDETMGILNKEGKEIYTFKVDEVDDKNIDIEISDVTEDLPLSDRYAKVKINDSSTIVNLESGKEVYTYTLKDINVLDNNVFFVKGETDEDNSTYIVIKDGQVKYKTSKYKRVRVDDYNSNIAICINNDATIEYVNLLTQKVINDNPNNEYYYSEGIVLEKSHDFTSEKDIYNIISASKVLGTFKDYTPENNMFYNKALSVKLYDGKYNYINLEGELINDKPYDEINDFNDGEYAIVSNDKNYGVINLKGKEIIPLSYIYLEQLDEDIFNLLKEENKELFLFKDENEKYGLIDNKNKVKIDSIYDKVEYITDKYPIILTSYQNDDLLINLSTGKELPIKILTNNIDIKENYIKVENDYYNYSGKLIYTTK